MKQKKRLAAKRPGQSVPRKTLVDCLDFDVLSEPWSKFRLSDGSRLRLKFVLLKIRSIKLERIENKRAASFGSQVITVIEAPKKFRGPPGVPLNPGEVADHVEASVGFRAMSTGPSVYRFDQDHTMVVNILPTKVQRTDAYAPDGDRIYQVETTAQIAILGGMTPGVVGSAAAPPTSIVNPATASS